MLSIGFFEILVIAVVALVVLGPEKLPGVMRTLAKIYRQIMNFKNEVTFQINNIDQEEKPALKKITSQTEEVVVKEPEKSL